MGDMDEEMVDEIAEPFVAVEIDLDYEFDAVRYFDFSRDESPAEARQAELWFESAKSYPPSPFVAKLVLREDILLGNVNTSPKSKDMEIAVVPDSDSAVALGQEIFTTDANNRDCGGTITNLQSGYLQNVHSQAQESISGLIFYNHMLNDNPKAQTKSTVKSVLPRSSTLMKPTASQLAKQNRPHQVGSFRFQTLLAQNNERGCINSSGVESQAAKRQKLEGGHLFKVADTKEQTNLVHKVPKKDATIDGNSMQARLKLTIPREPNLETAYRTQRMRSKHHTEVDQVALNVHRFKARPLNRKILEAPSLPLPKKSTPRLPEFQEFHLKTSERARQHTTGSSSSLHCNDPDKGLQKPSTNSVPENGNKDLRRPNTTDAPKQDACETVRTFKARPLNKKIFSSKGDIGVFRNSKRETTVPLEFNFQTEKRAQHNPPIELFNKLSLTSELQQKNDSQFKVPQPTCVSTKGSKENRLGFSQPENEIAYLVKDKLPQSRGVQIQCGSNGGINEINTKSGISRSLGIR